MELLRKTTLSELKFICKKIYDDNGNNTFPESDLEGLAVFSEVLYYYFGREAKIPRFDDWEELEKWLFDKKLKNKR